MIVYDVATKELDSEIFPQHIITDLNLWHYIYCFVQSGKAFTVKGNKHTHASAKFQTCWCLHIGPWVAYTNTFIINLLLRLHLNASIEKSTRNAAHLNKCVRQIIHACFGNFKYMQKQPTRGILKKRCSENMQQIYRKSLMLKCDFSKVAKQLYWWTCDR